MKIYTPFLIAIPFILSSCGQVGPLYLPGGQDDHIRNGVELDPTLIENQKKYNAEDSEDKETSSGQQKKQYYSNKIQRSYQNARLSNDGSDSSTNSSSDSNNRDTASNTSNTNKKSIDKSSSNGNTNVSTSSEESSVNNNSSTSSNSTSNTSSNNKSGSYTSKVDDDPSTPATDVNKPSSQSVDIGDNFAYDSNIMDSSQAGGTPA